MWNDTENLGQTRNKGDEMNLHEAKERFDELLKDEKQALED